MSPTHVASFRPHRPPELERGAGPPADSRAAAAAVDREHLLDRLQHFRAVLPVVAQQLASARRQAAQLRVENCGLVEEVRRLRRQRGESNRSRR